MYVKIEKLIDTEDAGQSLNPKPIQVLLYDSAHKKLAMYRKKHFIDSDSETVRRLIDLAFFLDGKE